MITAFNQILLTNTLISASGGILNVNGNNVITSNQTGAFGASGNFYPLNSNPSGYITSGQTGAFGASGNFYPLNSNPSGYITTGQTGNFGGGSTPTGNLTGVFYPLNANPSGYITGFNSGLYTLNSNTGSFITTGQTGAFGSSGNFYPLNTNPSGYITTGQTGQFASSVNLALTGTFLQNEITSLSGYTNSTFSTITNLGTTNTNIATTGSTLLGLINVLSGYDNSTFATITNLALTGNILQTKINSINIWTGASTGLFYPNSNPSGYINNTQTGVFITTGSTGQFITQSQNIFNLFYASTNKINFLNTGSYSVYTIPSGYVFFIDSMEVITSNVTSSSQAPYVSFGTNNVYSNFVNSIQTTSNSTYARHIYDNPQDGVPAGTIIYASITTGSTALVHSGYLVYKGFLITQ